MLLWQRHASAFAGHLPWRSSSRTDSSLVSASPAESMRDFFLLRMGGISSAKVWPFKLR